MKVLLSIKPEFANKIFDGSKKFEFRRSIFKNRAVKTVVVYASSPVKKVIGEFEIDHILNEELEILWNKTEPFSGIRKSFYDLYFQGKSKGFAIQVKDPKIYPTPLNLKETYGKVAPQSFVYLD